MIHKKYLLQKSPDHQKMTQDKAKQMTATKKKTKQKNKRNTKTRQKEKEKKETRAQSTQRLESKVIYILAVLYDFTWETCCYCLPNTGKAFDFHTVSPVMTRTLVMGWQCCRSLKPRVGIALVALKEESVKKLSYCRFDDLMPIYPVLLQFGDLLPVSHFIACLSLPVCYE